MGMAGGKEGGAEGKEETKTLRKMLLFVSVCACLSHSACQCVCACARSAHPPEGPAEKLETVGLEVYSARPILGVITQIENEK